METRVWAIIATYHRPELLRRALFSLRNQGPVLSGVMVIDNGGTGDLGAVAQEMSPLSIKVVSPEKNLGTAGGIALGMDELCRRGEATHCWVMDDDAVATPGALAIMLAAASAAGADVVSSLLADQTGRVGWFPGPLQQPAWDVIRSGVTPDEFRQRCGDAPLRWNWATWASLVVSCRAIAAVGLPDAKLWYQGTDIEYTLRLSARFTCVLAPGALCHHLMPPADPDLQRVKELWSLQNGAYVGVRLSHGHRLLRHLPGNHFRYWRRQHFQMRALVQSLRAFWRGAIRGRPVGLEQSTRVTASAPTKSQRAPTPPRR